MKLTWKERLALTLVVAIYITVGTMEYNDELECERMSAEQRAQEWLDHCGPETRAKRSAALERIGKMNGYQVITDTDCSVTVEKM